jgi:glycosyltransferase involved in cell wall biosynthesis
MRVLQVVHQYPPDHLGGTELYTQSVSRRQAAAGHRVAVFAPVNRHGVFDGEPAVEDGVRVYRAPAGERGAAAVFRSTYDHPDLADAFAAVLSAEQPDVVHVQHLMGIPAAVGRRLREATVPYVISLHDYWYGCANGQLLTNDSETTCAGPDAHCRNCGRCAVARAGLGGAAGLLGPLVAPLMRRRNAILRPIFDGAARVLAPNDFVRRVYADMGFTAERLVINPLGLDVPADLAERVHARRAARAACDLGVGYVGGLSRQKGVHVLIDAVNGLSEPGVTLDVYGDPAAFPDYVAGLRRSTRHAGVRFRGLLAHGHIWDALADLDVLVLPSLWYEASPAIIREAFATGLPVIASDLGAPAAMIRDGVDGLLFSPGDAAALRELLLSLAREPARLAELRAGITPPRPVADHLAQIETVYREVLDLAPALAA